MDFTGFPSRRPTIFGLCSLTERALDLETALPASRHVAGQPPAPRMPFGPRTALKSLKNTLETSQNKAFSERFQAENEAFSLCTGAVRREPRRELKTIPAAVAPDNLSNVNDMSRRVAPQTAQ